MFTLDDLGNADRFVATYVDEVRYVPEFKKWLVWKGTHWAISIGEHYSMASAMIRGLHDEAQAYLLQGNTADHKALAQHIVKSAGRIDTMLKIASAHDDIRTPPGWLDSAKNYLNCRNLTIDLTDGRIMAHDPTELLSKVTNAPYLPNAPRPRWEAFLAQVQPDPAVREYLKRLAGYSLMGATQERLLVFLHGGGRNGKSVFVEVLRHVFGDYAVGTPVTTFLEKRSETGSNDLARLRGARFVAASEFEEGAKANIALLKRVSGDEKITARPLYGEYFDFPFEGTIWISTNHMPYVGVSTAVWDRIKIIDFPTRISDEQVDVHMKKKLEAEAAGILAWAVEGARAYVAHGLEEPTSVLLSADNEKMKQNLLQDFLDDQCDQYFEASTPARGLYRQYSWWAAQSGERPMTDRTFKAKLQELGFTQKRTSSGNAWMGLTLKAGINALA